MAISAGFRDYLFEILAPLAPLKITRFFGLEGIKAGDGLLGFVLDEKIYFRTDETTRKAYAREGGEPFTFESDRHGRVVTSYYSLPARLYDDPDELLTWAKRAHAAALEAPSAKKRLTKRARAIAKRQRRRR